VNRSSIDSRQRRLQTVPSTVDDPNRGEFPSGRNLVSAHFSEVKPAAKDSWSRALRRLGILAVFVASGVLYATVPPSPDQWFLGYTGWRLTQGAVPYIDFADGNWPACHWLHAVSVLLLGNTPYTWRTFDFVIMAVAAVCASRVARDLWGRSAATWLLVLRPALYVVNGYWSSGERDAVGANFLLIALWFYWAGLRKRQALWQIGTGLLIALSTLVKPTFAVFGLFLALHCLFAVRDTMCSPRERFFQIAVAGISSFLGILAGFGVLVMEGSHLDTFWELGVESIVVRYGNDSPGFLGLLQKLLDRVSNSWHWIFAGAAVALVARFWRSEPDKAARNLLFPVLWMTGLISYFLQVQGLGYTMDVLYTATVAILCSGLGLISLRHGRPTGWRLVLLTGLVLVPVLGTAKKWSTEFRSSFNWLAGRAGAEDHYAKFGAGDGISVSEAMALAAELKRKVPEGGTILVWGRANAINFLAKRRQPTRFHHNVTITNIHLPEGLARKWNRLFSEEVQEAAPEACLVNQRELSEPRPLPESVTFLKDYLDRRYQVVRKVGESQLYFRK
jgi:dolichyl-phosphate-mannose-protein mannosyltransferase